MAYIVSFENYTPSARFDGNAWTEVLVEEAPASSGPWTVIDTIALSPTDTDPAEPAARSFTTDQGTAPNQWYRVRFSDGLGDTSLPSPAVQNVATLIYATVQELFRILKVRTPSAAQVEAAERVLEAATTEINAEIDFRSDSDPLSGDDLSLVQTVCLDRAADLWRHTETAAGLLGIPDETLAPMPTRYSWERYAQRLAPLKQSWGFS